jgi:hypothetical protein
LWEVIGTKGSIGILRFDPQGASSVGDKTLFIQIEGVSKAVHHAGRNKNKDKDFVNYCALDSPRAGVAFSGHGPTHYCMQENSLNSGWSYKLGFQTSLEASTTREFPTSAYYI